MKLPPKISGGLQYAKDVVGVIGDIAQVVVYFCVAVPLAKVLNKSVK
jgi:hypothetical protein